MAASGQKWAVFFFFCISPLRVNDLVPRLVKLISDANPFLHKLYNKPGFFGVVKVMPECQFSVHSPVKYRLVFGVTLAVTMTFAHLTPAVTP